MEEPIGFYLLPSAIVFVLGIIGFLWGYSGNHGGLTVVSVLFGIILGGVFTICYSYFYIKQKLNPHVHQTVTEAEC